MNVAAVRSRTNRTLGILVLWGVSYIAARLALDVDVNLGPAWLRLATALLPFVPTVLALRAIAAAIREADELDPARLRQLARQIARTQTELVKVQGALSRNGSASASN